MTLVTFSINTPLLHTHCGVPSQWWLKIFPMCWYNVCAYLNFKTFANQPNKYVNIFKPHINNSWKAGYWLTSCAGDGDGKTLQLVHLQPWAAEWVEIYGLKARDLHGVDSCSRSLSLAQLRERLHRGQCDLCSCWTLDLNGLPAHLAIGPNSAQQDGACVWHNLEVLKPFLAESWSSKYLTACGRDSTCLYGLEGCSTLNNLLRLDKDLLWLLSVSVVWLYRDAQRRYCVLL